MCIAHPRFLAEVIELGIKGFFLTQGQTAHWSYVVTHTG
jgi:hypothetical protein